MVLAKIKRMKYKCSISAYFIFLGMFIIPIGLFACILWIHGSNAAHGIMLVPWIMLGISYLWLMLFQIEINSQFILYRRLFGGSTKIMKDSIKKVEFNFGIKEYSDRFKPMDRCTIRYDADKEIHINLKVFPYEVTKLLKSYK